LRTILLIAAFGAAGALSRYGLSSWTQTRLGAAYPAFPYGTLMVNVLGCFLLGFVVHFGQHSTWLPEEWRLGLTWGFLGALTTFSTFGMDTVAAFEKGHTTAGLANIGLFDLIRSERGVVEPIQERAPLVASTQVKRARPSQQPRTVGFFEALFGGGGSAAPVPRGRIR